MRNKTFSELEAENAKLRDVLTKVEAWFASEDGPLFKLWGDGDICNYDDNELTWKETLADVRNMNIYASCLGYGTEWSAVTLYRKVLAALRAAPESEEVNNAKRG